MSIYRPTREEIFRRTKENIRHLIAQMALEDLEDAVLSSGHAKESLLQAIKVNSPAQIFSAMQQILHDHYYALASSSANEWADDVEADEKIEHGYHTMHDKRMGANDEHD